LIFFSYNILICSYSTWWTLLFTFSWKKLVYSRFSS